MSASTDIFPHRADFASAGDFDAFPQDGARQVGRLPPRRRKRHASATIVREEPAREPAAALGAGDEPGVRTKRIDYRDLIRLIHWRRVDSAFEATRLP